MSISNIVNNFSRNLGNGQKMGEALLDAINHAIKTGDTSIISVLFMKVNDKKDSNALTGLTATVRAVYIGANITLDKKTNRTIVKTKNATLSNSAVEVLNQLVVDSVSMRGNKWAKADLGEYFEKFKAGYDADDIVWSNDPYKPLKRFLVCLWRRSKRAACTTVPAAI